MTQITVITSYIYSDRLPGLKSKRRGRTGAVVQGRGGGGEV